MSHLKIETANKCFSLLREYIEETSLDNLKAIAILALNQLHAITAGADSDYTGDEVGDYTLSCNGKPRAYSS